MLALSGQKIIIYFFHKLYGLKGDYMPSPNVNIDSTLANIGARVRQHRTQRGFTREQLAELSGLSVQSIVKIESGTRNFRILSLISISKALGLSADYLLGLSENDETQDILLLLSMMSPKGKRFIKDFIQLYLHTG